MNALTPMTAFRTVQTPAVGKPKTDAGESAAKMAATRERLIARALAALTPKQREQYPSLPLSDRQYIIENCRWPTGILMLPKIANQECQAAGKIGGVARAKNAKTEIELREVMRWIEDGNRTANDIYHNFGTGCSFNDIRDALDRAVGEGVAVARKFGRITRYSPAIAPKPAK